MGKRGIHRELEVEVNEKRLRLVQTRLLHKIQRAGFFLVEVVVEEIKELWVFLVRN
jgi:hypothetical protein